MLKGLFKKNDKVELEEYIDDEETAEEVVEEVNEDTTNMDDVYGFETYDEYVERTTKQPMSPKKIRKIINIVFCIVIVILAMITIDVVNVSRYNKGPFFAIRTQVLDDGGTKIYYGFGYKVIKYHQLQGRRDIQIGFWTMPYSVEPTDIKSIDLAIEFRNKPTETYQKYYKKFLRINGTIKKVDTEKNRIIITYKDPDNKYTLRIVCPLANNKAAKKFKTEQDVYAIGTVRNYKPATKETPNTLYMSDCFAE